MKQGTPFSSGVQEVEVDNNRIAEIEAKIADLKARWPAHSVPPSMWIELEELEDQLDRVKKEIG